MKETEIVERPKSEIQDAHQPPQSADLIIQQAVEKGVPVETLEKLLAMRRELKAEAAKEAFDAAMARFQSACPIIEKNKTVKDKYGKTLYSYASIDMIVGQVKEVLGQNGLSYTTKTDVEGGKVKVSCIVTHKLGHSQSSEMEVPIGSGTQIMSAPQLTAAATTFAKRYAFCNALGIITGDGDIDGKIDELADKPTPSAAVAPIKPVAASTDRKPTSGQLLSANQMAALEDLLQTYGMPFPEFLKAYKIKNLAELTSEKAEKATTALKERIEAGEMWEQPNMPTISNEEPAAIHLPKDFGGLLPPIEIEAEVAETQPAPWEKWKKDGPRN